MGPLLVIVLLSLAVSTAVGSLQPDEIKMTVFADTSAQLECDDRGRRHSWPINWVDKHSTIRKGTRERKLTPSKLTVAS